ncbi:DUF6086 family protein [Streptomyces sp. NPDC055912]|uniref:DUF6086 family protein n=1 Tax=Streptomyces sp. NPDC055912 TaxID=3345660 RepID=UPI0035E1F552
MGAVAAPRFRDALPEDPWTVRRFLDRCGLRVDRRRLVGLGGPHGEETPGCSSGSLLHFKATLGGSAGPAHHVDRLGGCDIELPTFRVFVEGLYYSYSHTNSAVLQGLWRGLLVTSLVLLDMAGSPIALSAEHEEALRSDMASFGCSMGASNWGQYGN